MTAKYGLITGVEIGLDSASIEQKGKACLEAEEALVGQRYEDVTILEKLAVDAREPHARELFSDLAKQLKVLM